MLTELARPISAAPPQVSTSEELPQTDIDSLRVMKKKDQTVDEWVAAQIGNTRCFLVSTLPDLYTARQVILQAEVLIEQWESDTKNYQTWKVELEELLTLGEDIIFKSEILGEESFDFVRTLHSRLDLTLEVTRQLVESLQEKVNKVKYSFNLCKSFVMKASGMDPFSTDTYTPEESVLGGFDEMMNSRYQSPEGVDEAKMVKLTEMVLKGHDTAKMVDEFRSNVPDLEEHVEMARYRRASLKKIDEDGIFCLLQAFGDNK